MASSEFFFVGSGDSLYLYFTFVVTDGGVTTTSFRLLLIDGTSMSLSATYKKTTTGSDTTRGLYVNTNNVYLGLSTNSNELRTFTT